MATILNVRDKLLQDPTVSRYSRSIQTFTQATQPWVNLVQTPVDPSVQEVTKVVSGVVVNPAGNYATLFKPTAVSAAHSAGTTILTNYVAYSSPNKVQLTGYFKDDGSDYRVQLVVNARTADSVTNRTLIYKFRPSTGIGSLVQTAAGWSANSINVLAIGNGWWKVVVRGTFTTTASAESVINAEFDILNTSDASNFASVDTNKGLYIYGLQAYLGVQPDEMLGDTWVDTTNATSSRWNGYSWDSLGGSAVLTYLDTTSPVIFKQAPDASTSGAHTNITTTGKRTTNGTTANYGFLTVTGNGDVEASTATANTITTSIADAAGKTSYTVKLYNQATVSGATTLDTMVIPIVFKGATGSDGLTAILTNESHSVPTDSAGGSGNYTGSGTDIYVYEGSTQLAWDGSGTTAGKFTVSRSASNITAGGTIIANGNAARDPDHSNMTADVATVTYTITGKRVNGSNFTITKVQSTSKSKAGVAGSTGASGASSRTAYARIPSNPTAISTTKTVSGDNRPTSTESATAWGASFNVSWIATDPSPGSSDSLYQIDGIYDPATANTVWSSPYISSLKVGTLSAVTANTGNLNVTGNLTMSNTSSILGGQTAYNTGSGFFLGYSGGAYKLSLGSAGSNTLTWDGTDLKINSTPVTTIETNTNNYGGQVKTITLSGSQTSFYPVYIQSNNPYVGGSTYYDVVVNRPSVHMDSTFLCSYTCHIYARSTSWGNSAGAIIEVDQVSGSGTYTYGVADVNVSSAGNGIWVLLRGGMTHIISLSQPIGGYTVTAYTTTQTEANGNVVSVSTTGPLVNYLNKAYCPAAPLDWGASVGGTGKPADNAGSVVTLINQQNMTIVGNTVWKSSGAAGWGTDSGSVYSKDSYTGGAYVSFSPATASDGQFLMGLNSDPTSDTSWGSLDYALYCEYGGGLYAYESGSAYAAGSYAAGDVLAVTYDGTAVRYLKNGTILRTTIANISAPLFLDSAFFSPSSVGKVTNIQFGPMTSNAWSAIGGAGNGKPADYATVGATFGVNINGQAQTSHIANGAVTSLAQYQVSSTSIYSAYPSNTSSTGAIVSPSMGTFTNTSAVNAFKLRYTGQLNITCTATTQMLLRANLSILVFDSTGTTQLLSSTNPTVYLGTVGGDTSHWIPFHLETVFPSYLPNTAKQVKIGVAVVSRNPTSGASISNIESVFITGQLEVVEFKV